MLLRSNPNVPRILHLPTLTLSRIVPVVKPKSFGTRKEVVVIKLNVYLTSRVFESKGSFQAGFSQPTLAERSVRLRYLGAISEGYWETPLSTPSIASTNSYALPVNRCPGAWREKGGTLYSLSQRVPTVGSSSWSWNLLAMISWPKCLHRNQFHPRAKWR